jgi:DNA topoisomerase I
MRTRKSVSAGATAPDARRIGAALSAALRRSKKRTTVPPPVVAPTESARSAALRYVTDATPGIRRRKAGTGFTYIDAASKPVRDEATLARIKSLAIPPAWTDVWICPLANGHIQATGRDARGRKQYRYHSKWHSVRDETKYGRMIHFGNALPRIRERVNADLARRGLPREKILAVVVRLLETTYIRVGNEEYARTNGSFGLTTLLDDHVAIRGERVRFCFRGKSGKAHTVEFTDKRVASVVRHSRDLPGQDLFQYIGEDGEPHPINSADVNDYLREIGGEDFTAKDFRTWAGTLLAASRIGLPPDAGSSPRGALVSSIKVVAEQLGNTPAVCRKGYIHPLVLQAYEDRSMAERWLDAVKSARAKKGLTREENALLTFLENSLTV